MARPRSTPSGVDHKKKTSSTTATKTPAKTTPKTTYNYELPGASGRSESAIYGAPVAPTRPVITTTNTTYPTNVPGKTPEQLAKEAQASADAAQLAAEARAKAERDAEKKKAGERFLESAGNLDAQVAAIKHALEQSFGSALEQNLQDVGLNLGQQLEVLKSGHALRAQGFLDTAKDTEIATAGQSDSAFGNLIRERQDGMTAILEHGVGESDALRSMVMAARNWQANQSEGNRSYFDTMRSVNNGITDLNMDTKTAPGNAATTAESERERLWQDFYNKRSESFTQLGNVRGQQRDYYAQAKEMGVTPPGTAEADAKTDMETAYMDAAKEAGKSYVQQGIPKDLQDWKGQAQQNAVLQNTNLASAVRFEPFQKAEGASSLRGWA